MNSSPARALSPVDNGLSPPWLDCEVYKVEGRRSQLRLFKGKVLWIFSHPLVCLGDGSANKAFLFQSNDQTV